MENPVAGIFKIMQDEGSKLNPPTLSLGKVMTPYPEITIELGDMVLAREELKIADYLAKAYKRKIEVKGVLTGKTNSTSGGSGDAAFSGHLHTISDTASLVGEMMWTDTLNKGDEVLLLPSPNGNTYYVLCKVM